MRILLDTNILVRWVQTSSPDHSLAVAAVESLRAGSEELLITPQNLIEFWGVATRPADVGGIGLSVERTAQETRGLQVLFTLLPEEPALFEEWLRLVESIGVHGRQVHDARIAAAMRVHGVTYLLTFNDVDFRRYPGIKVVHPRDVPPVTKEKVEQV